MNCELQINWNYRFDKNNRKIQRLASTINLLTHQALINNQESYFSVLKSGGPSQVGVG